MLSIMNKKFVSFFLNNTFPNTGNSIFDVKRKADIEAPIYRCFGRLKYIAEQRNIYINTYDVKTKYPPVRYVHLEVPHPLPSNFHIWKSIIANRMKNILLIIEPPIVNPFNHMRIVHKFFKKVYTCRDELVDNKKYFKFRFPKSSVGIKTQIKNFKEKKFLILINSNKLPFYPFKLMSTFGKELYSERIKAIEFFEQNIPSKFFLYGKGWNNPKKYNLKERILGYRKYQTYKGRVDNKLKLLSNFKFCICFENMTDIKGYISEKIFDCFKAKCVPIYWGAADIEEYIPKDCFIDFRDFDSFKELLIFLESIDENRYNCYIKNIEKLLADKKFLALWFEEGFSKFFLEDILES